MNLRKLIFTENDCYKTGRKMKVKGIMLHSTGANNPYLSRYVQPDDGYLGKNIYNNHWNMSNAEAKRRFGNVLDKCCHAFIGYLKDKKGIATYQVLPWDHRGWHAGWDVNGSANDGYISVEICEDDRNDKIYAMAVLKEAVEWAAYLCELFKLNPLGKEVIIDHNRGRELKIASGHYDIIPWWYGKWGVTLDSIRRDVKAVMDENKKPKPEPTRFKDVPKSHWAYNHIENLSKLGIVKGYSDGTFKPEEPMTRAQVCKLIDMVINEKK